VSSEKLQKGQLVKIKLGAVNWTSDGFATIGGSNNKASLFEFIDLATYPSFNDFLGSSYSVDNKSVATILKYVGRPFKISKDPAWFEYDVYEILINGNICQSFKQNLMPIKKK
tara:strand:+ start:669 stop:1007 length:339 start_codon:yes stop_codon:yes gene_type:complete